MTEVGVVGPCTFFSHGFSPDWWLVLRPFVSGIKSLVYLFTSNKVWYDSLKDRDGPSRLTFALIVARLTELPSKGFVAEKITQMLTAIQERGLFMQHVRALVCPWTSTKRITMIRGLSDHIHTHAVLDVFDDESKLVVASLVTPEKYFSINIGKGADSSFATLVRDDDISERLLEAKKLLDNTNCFSDEIRAKLSGFTDFIRFTCLTGCTPTLSFFPIHGSAFAITLSCNANTGCTESSRSIYYFSIPSGEMLAHRVCSGWPMSSHSFRTFVQSRPFSLFILNEKQVQMHRMETGMSIRLSEPSERIGTAMFMVSCGRIDDALAFVRNIPGADINTTTAFNRRSLVHVAAEHGQTEALARLLELNAVSGSVDLCGSTPLGLAIQRLEHGTVEILLKNAPFPAELPGPFLNVYTDPSVTAWDDAWSHLCCVKTIHKCILRHPERLYEYCEVAIPNIIKGLWARHPTSLSDESLYHRLVTAARSPVICSSKHALKFVLQSGVPMSRFMAEGGFKTTMSYVDSPEREDFVIDAIRMCVQELEMDINSTAGPTHTSHLIKAVQDGSLKMVRFLIEELHADTRALGFSNEPILAIAASRARYRPGDADAAAILQYIRNNHV